MEKIHKPDNVISDTCFLSDPPIHSVSINGDPGKMMSGREIYLLLKKYNMSDKRFDKFNDEGMKKFKMNIIEN